MKTATNLTDQKDKNQQAKTKFQKTNRAPIHKATSREGSSSAGSAQPTTVQKLPGNKNPCFVCKSRAYWAKDCPKAEKGEAPGRGKLSSKTSMIAPVPKWMLWLTPVLSQQSSPMQCCTRLENI